MRSASYVRYTEQPFLAYVDNVSPELRIVGAWFAVRQISRIKFLLTTPHNGVRSVPLERYFLADGDNVSQELRDGGVVCGSSHCTHQTCFDYVLYMREVGPPCNIYNIYLLGHKSRTTSGGRGRG